MEKEEGIFKTIHINSVKELFELLSPWGEYKHLLSGFIFRGEDSSLYQLIPSALRKNLQDILWRLSGLGIPINDQWEYEKFQRDAEYSALRNFYKISDDKGLNITEINRIRSNINNVFGINDIDDRHVWLPKDILELAGLAQHYGIPTRLLDWSYDYKTALYFASKGFLSKESPGDKKEIVLWALNASHIEFLKHTVAMLPLYIIKPRYAGNSNLQAQSGVFTHWEDSRYCGFETIISNKIPMVERIPLNQLLEKYTEKSFLDSDKKPMKILFKFIIPSAYAKELLKILITDGYNGSKLFPGYDGVVKYMNEKSLII